MITKPTSNSAETSHENSAPVAKSKKTRNLIKTAATLLMALTLAAGAMLSACSKDPTPAPGGDNSGGGNTPPDIITPGGDDKPGGDEEEEYPGVTLDKPQQNLNAAGKPAILPAENTGATYENEYASTTAVGVHGEIKGTVNNQYGHTKSKLELKQSNQCKSKSRDSLRNLDFLSTYLEC